MSKLLSQLGIFDSVSEYVDTEPDRHYERLSLGGPPVGNSQDLRRVLALPRRGMPSDLDLVREDLKRPHGTMKLRPEQAWALKEAAEMNGLLAPLGVGAGKTLISMLLPMVMKGCKNAVLLIPPDIREQFYRDWDRYGKHWMLPNLSGGRTFVAGRPVLHVVAYSQLSSPRSSILLRQLKPDLIIADEAHNVKNKRGGKSVRTKRFLKFFKENPECRLCAMSGTMTSRSLWDYAHLAELALHEGSPLPLNWPTLEEWCTALDSIDWPAPPGELMQLCASGEELRAGWGRRLSETPGVIASGERTLGTGLVIRSKHPSEIPGELLTKLADVRCSWTRPDGEELVDALAAHMCLRQLACGFYLYWKFPRGEPVSVIETWFSARQDWNREVREKLKTSREQMDSPRLLAEAAIRFYKGKTGTPGELPYEGQLPVWQSETWLRWKSVHKTVYHETHAKWISDYVVRDAAAWGHKHKGIIWVESPELGMAIAKEAKIPWFGGGTEASGLIIQEKGNRSIVASIAAHNKGKNLQEAFSINLVVQPPSSGVIWEQMIGRTHRPGQLADTVEVDVYQHTTEFQAAIDGARKDADYQQTSGGVKKLSYASFVGFD